MIVEIGVYIRISSGLRLLTIVMFKNKLIFRTLKSSSKHTMWGDSRMNLDYLKNFIEIVNAKSISAASRKILIAQPALSYQLKMLEQHYGATLIIRGTKEITLTAAGKILYEKAKSILLLENNLLTSIPITNSGKIGTLCYGMIPSHPDSLLDSLFNSFYLAFPELSFEVFEQPSDLILNLLRDCVVDIVIFRLFERDINSISPDIDVLFSIDEQLMLYFKNDNPWIKPGIESVHITSLKGVPLSISKAFKDHFTFACQSSGFSPTYLSINTTRASSRRWAEAGYAVAINSGRILPQEEHHSYCFLDGENTHLKIVFAKLHGRYLSPVTQTFISYCKSFFKNIYD